MAASHFKLDNITVIIDNNFQQTGKRFNNVDLAILKSKWKSFNWDVKEINGHIIYEEILNL